ncbi:ATP-binding protein [Fibrella aquatica]|uniref:ATP-binding protein n=1 Tax=Fibrella aquatica TaxID=3242487 RepID=UPI0035213691
MKWLLTVSLLGLCLCQTLAQRSLSDSLQRRLEQPLPDTTRVQVLDQLSRSLMYSKPLVAMQYAQQGIKLARQSGDSRGEARIQNRIGTIFRLTGNYDRSLEAHLNSVSVAEANHDTDALARTYNNMGNLYSEQKNSPKAIEFYQKTTQLAGQLGNRNLQRIALSNIGSEYALLNQLDSALTFTRTAYQYARQSKATDIQIELMILANVYKRMKRYELALMYYRKSIPASIAVKNDRTLSQTYLEMAEVFRATQQTDSVTVYARRALQLAQSSGMLTTIQQASVMLADVYEASAPHQSLVYLKLASVAKDSLVDEEKVKNFQNIEFSEKLRLDDAQRLEEAFRTRITMYLLTGGIATLLLIALILYRNNSQKQKANGLLQKQRDEISLQRQKAERALDELKATQVQLIQREKLASLGELTAGIAHEIQNPLNFVNNFSEVSTELVEEIQEERQKTPDQRDELLETELLADLHNNLQKIAQHGQRAGNIVRGMLEHSRARTGERAPTNLNALTDEYLRLAYHGARAKDKSFNCQLTTDLDASLGEVTLVPQDMGRVLLNLFTNAFYAVQQRGKQAQADYQPTVWVTTRRSGNRVTIQVRDNGTGIPAGVIDKIFQPFFTSKPTGEGTGLGLSLSYDIVTKGHGGTLEADTKVGEGTTFTIALNV